MNLSPTPAEISRSVDADRLAALLGYPPDIRLEGPVLALSDQSRRWYTRNGDPWTRTRALPIIDSGGARVRLLGDIVLSSPLLASRLRRCEPRELVIAAVSAGPAIDRRVDALWADQRPDEAFFLDRFGAVVTESLAAGVGRELRRLAEIRGLGVLPAMRPGCEGWGLGDQMVLADCLRAPDQAGANQAVASADLVVLDSGALKPKNSLLAGFAVVGQLPAGWDRVEQCSWCSLPRCEVRRDRPVFATGAEQ